METYTRISPTEVKITRTPDDVIKTNDELIKEKEWIEKIMADEEVAFLKRKQNYADKLAKINAVLA